MAHKVLSYSVGIAGDGSPRDEDAVAQSARTHTPSVAPLEREAFFAIMGAFPTGVTVVTTLDEAGRPVGLTVSALCSVSAEPRLMLVSIDRSSNTLPSLRHTRRFAVNYLAYGSEDVARLFASKEPDKFSGLRWRAAANGMPWLYDHTLALAECSIVQEVQAGDHVLFIASVEGGQHPEPRSRPLVYFRRRYGTVDTA